MLLDYNGYRKQSYKSTKTGVLNDKGGHFGPVITLGRLNQSVYWPCMAQDTIDYYLGCIRCAKYNAAKPKSPNLPVTICAPFQIIVVDFVGPFPATITGRKYILCGLPT